MLSMFVFANQKSAMFNGIYHILIELYTEIGHSEVLSDISGLIISSRQFVHF